MIEAKVPKDIRSYKTKMIGPLTLRQFLCIFIIGIMDFAIYSYIIKPLHINIDVSGPSDCCFRMDRAYEYAFGKVFKENHSKSVHNAKKQKTDSEIRTR